MATRTVYSVPAVRPLNVALLLLSLITCAGGAMLSPSMVTVYCFPGTLGPSHSTANEDGDLADTIMFPMSPGAVNKLQETEIMPNTRYHL